MTCRASYGSNHHHQKFGLTAGQTTLALWLLCQWWDIYLGWETGDSLFLKQLLLCIDDSVSRIISLYLTSAFSLVVHFDMQYWTFFEKDSLHITIVEHILNILPPFLYKKMLHLTNPLIVGHESSTQLM
jgi:hypothetical protein